MSPPCCCAAALPSFLMAEDFGATADSGGPPSRRDHHAGQPDHHARRHAGGTARHEAAGAGAQPVRQAAGHFRLDQPARCREPGLRRNPPARSVSRRLRHRAVARRHRGVESQFQGATQFHRPHFFPGRLASLPRQCQWRCESLRRGQIKNLAAFFHPVAKHKNPRADQ